MMVADPGSNGV